MADTPKLLILGGGPCQLHAFALAKARGMPTALFDYLPHPPAAALADIHVQVSTFDVEACLAAAAKLPLAGVMTLGTDQPVYTAACIAERYGLPSLLDVPTAFAVTNKEAMKRTFDAHGIPCVPWQVVDPASLARADWSGPVVLKPLDSQGQRGVLRCESAQEASRRFEDARSHSRREELLLETFYPADEVTLSAWVSQGQAQLLTATDRLTFADPVHIGICAAHRYPSRAAAGCMPEMRAVTQAVAEAFSLREGPLYIQVLLGAQGPLVNEVACRIGGAFEDVFIPPLTGFDILGAVMDAALGRPVPPPILQPRQGEVRELMLFTRPGTIATLTPIEVLRSLPFVLDAGYALGPGDTVPPLEHAGSRLGHAVLRAGDAAEMTANLRSFYEIFSVRDAAGRDLLLRREIE